MRVSSVRNLIGLLSVFALQMPAAILSRAFPMEKALGGFSSVGRASALQAEGQRFESAKLHHFNTDTSFLSMNFIDWIFNIVYGGLIRPEALR